MQDQVVANQIITAQATHRRGMDRQSALVLAIGWLAALWITLT